MVILGSPSGKGIRGNWDVARNPRSEDRLILSYKRRRWLWDFEIHGASLRHGTGDFR